MPEHPSVSVGEICRSQTLLAEAEELANLGSWEHDLEAGTVFQSANLRRMLDAEPTVSTLPAGDIWRYVDPDDGPRVRRVIAGAMRTAQAYEFQVRMVLPSGRRRVFHVRGKPIANSENRIVRRIGVAMDVTERLASIHALRQSEEMYRDLVENSHSMICTHDLSGKLLSLNELPAKILGYSPEELVGKRVQDMLPSHGQELYDGYLERIQRAGHATGLLTLKTRSGERRVWEYHNTLRVDGVREPVIRGMAHDITERFEAEKRLRKSESLLAQAEELANVGSWEFDVNERTVHSSTQFHRMLGLAPTSGPRPLEQGLATIHPDDRERALRNIEALIAGENEYQNQLRFVAADGKERLFHSRAVAVRDTSGRVVKIRGMSQDVTERQREEEKLRKSEALLAQAEALANVGSWEHDLRNHTLNWSSQFYRMLGLTPGPERISPERGLDLIHPDDRARAVREIEALTAGGQECETELRFRAVDGRERILLSRAVAEADSSGRVVKVRGMSQDITQRKREEERLRKSEALLAQAERLANVGSWELDVRTHELNWSAQYFRMLGLEPEPGPVPYGSGIAMIHPDDRERGVHDLGSLAAGGQEFENELRFINARGEERIFHSRGVAVSDESGRVVIVRGMSQDVTERRREEHRLRKSEALLSQAEQMANCGSWEVDVKTRKINFSNNLRKMIGIGPGQEVKYEDYWDRVQPEDRDRAMKIIGEAIEGVKPFEHISRYLPPEGGMRFHFARGIPIGGPDGKAAMSMGVVQDITDRVRIEQELHSLLRKLLTVRDEDRRRLARQLHESVGQTLAALTMGMGRLRESLEGRGTASHALWRSCNELARQAARETREISYSMHPHMLDEAGLGSALRCYARDFAEMSGIDVHVDVPEGFARQPREVETTVFRIVQEALTNVHRHSGSRTANVHLSCENQHLRAEVTDEGRGFPAAPSSFRPSQQGVGITGMRERAEQLHGTFELESSPGHGTTIRVSLPLAAPRRASAG